MRRMAYLEDETYQSWYLSCGAMITKNAATPSCICSPKRNGATAVLHRQMEIQDCSARTSQVKGSRWPELQGSAGGMRVGEFEMVRA